MLLPSSLFLLYFSTSSTVYQLNEGMINGTYAEALSCVSMILTVIQRLLWTFFFRAHFARFHLYWKESHLWYERQREWAYCEYGLWAVNCFEFDISIAIGFFFVSNDMQRRKPAYFSHINFQPCRIHLLNWVNGNKQNHCIFKHNQTRRFL